MSDLDEKSMEIERRKGEENGRLAHQWRCHASFRRRSEDCWLKLRWSKVLVVVATDCSCSAWLGEKTLYSAPPPGMANETCRDLSMLEEEKRWDAHCPSRLRFLFKCSIEEKKLRLVTDDCRVWLSTPTSNDNYHWQEGEEEEGEIDEQNARHGIISKGWWRPRRRHEWRDGKKKERRRWDNHNDCEEKKISWTYTSTSTSSCSFSLASFLFRRWFALLAATNLSLSLSPPSTWTNLSKVFYLSDRMICCDYWFLLWMRRKRERETERRREKSRFFRSSAFFFSLYISDSLLRLSYFRSGQSTQRKSKRERNSRNPSCIDRCLYLLHCFIIRNWRRKRFLFCSLSLSPLSPSNVMFSLQESTNTNQSSCKNKNNE